MPSTLLRAMSAGSQTLPVLERLLLHLQHVDPAGRGAAPEEQTQTGIASAIGIQRKHIPRALRRLVEKGWVNLVLKHVDGRRQRVRVHVLSGSGFVEVERLREVHRNHTTETAQGFERTLDIIDDGRMQHITSSRGQAPQHDLKHRSSRAMQEVAARMLGCTGHELGQMMQEANVLVDEPPITLDGPEAVFLSCLDTALNDGVISDDEEAMLTTLRQELGPFGASLKAHVVNLLHDMMK